MTVAERKIGLKSPGEGAYRVRLIGADPTQAAQAFLTGRDDEATVSLPPGDYTAYVEDLTQATRSVTIVTVPAHGRKPWLSLPASSRKMSAYTTTLRPSDSYWNARSSELSSLVEAAAPDRAPQERAFSVGVSVDTELEKTGGWSGERPAVTVHYDPDQQALIIDIERCDDWRKRPKWRLTVAVQGARAWRTPLALFEGGLRVALRVVQTPKGPDVAAGFAPCRAMTATLIASLSRLDSDEARRVLGWDDQVALDEAAPVSKVTDPWAAAAKAVLLARNGDIAGHEAWIIALAKEFPWLPDAQVAASWALAASSAEPARVMERQCVNALAEARRRGSPYFVASNRLALDLLNALAVGAEDSQVRTVSKAELKAWSRHSLRAVRTGAFLSWERAGPKLQSGRLPSRTYAVIAEGAITGDRVFRIFGR